MATESTPRREQFGLVFDAETQTRRKLVAERLAERQNNTDVKNLSL